MTAPAALMSVSAFMKTVTISRSVVSRSYACRSTPIRAPRSPSRTSARR